MSLESLDYHGITAFLAVRAQYLQLVDADIERTLLLLEEQSINDDAARFGVFQRLEALRFQRNKARSEALDAQFALKLVKRRYFESRFNDALLMHPGAHNMVLVACGAPFITSSSIEMDMLIQQRQAAYKKLEGSFKDQSSMRLQKHLAELSGHHSQEWIGRLEHALSKSRRYFARQCSLISSIREQIYALSLNEQGHVFYCSAVDLLGQEKVNAIAEEIVTSKAA